jgi:hypothetical protein
MKPTKNVVYFDSILWHSVHNLDRPFKPLLPHLTLNNFTNHAKFFIYNPLLFYMLMNLDSVINIRFLTNILYILQIKVLYTLLIRPSVI